MKDLHVFFRVDGNAHIGLGHLTRCLALADMLIPDFSSTFIVREPTAAISFQIQQAGFALWEVPAELSIADEPAWLSSRLPSHSILVLDGYAFGASYQKVFKAQNQPLVYLDDLLTEYAWADLVINQAGGVRPEQYAHEPATSFCLGPAYALLRPAFIAAARAVPIPPDTSRIFLNMGGADPDNQTLHDLHYIRRHLPLHRIEVVAGSAYPHMALLRQATQGWPDVHVHHNLDATQMVSLLQQCGLKVCPPSGVSYECCSIGGLVLLHPLADNQQHLFAYLVAQQLALPLSALAELPQENIPDLAAQMQKRQRAIFDGQAARRFRQAFQELAAAYALVCRRANDDDATQYFSWANDPLVRSNAIEQAPIAWENHLAWFSKRIKNPNSVLYVFELQDQLIGQVRIDFTESDGIIDYSVDAAQRGRGLGLAILRRALLALRNDCPGPWVLIAQVKDGNLPSRRVFERLGFQPQPPVVLHGQLYDEFRLAFTPPA